MGYRARPLIGQFIICLPWANVHDRHPVGTQCAACQLAQAVRLLVSQNPCFGLDVSAIREIDSRLPEERNRGAVVLMLSEDVDKLLELAKRVMVMLEGRLVFETDPSQAKALRVTMCCSKCF